MKNQNKSASRKIEPQRLHCSGKLLSWCFLLLSCGIASCKKFVEVPPPQSQLVTASVFNSDGSATSAVIGIYTNLFSSSESYALSRHLGYYSDELTNNSKTISEIQFYTNALLSGTTYPEGWNAFFQNNYYSNAVISGLQTTSGTHPAVNQQLKGEAYFIRAFCHFYLTNEYGDVPIVLTTNYQINGSISRSPRVQVLKQVVNDLEVAKSLLNSNYVDGSDTIVTTEKVRPNKAAALALLARAYLYLGDYSGQNAGYYQKADSAASAVIGSGVYSLSSLNSAFLKNSSEAIWQLQTPLPTTSDTPDGNGYILTGAPKNASISPQLISAFESGDQRKLNWIGSYTTTTLPAKTYYYPYKYKDNSLNFSGTPKEYVMVLRLAEQYLIRAEAQAHGAGNGISGAIADINLIRNRAGLSNYAGATDQASVLAAILHERQVELFTEWGHRWFDLCRTGNAPAVMTVVAPTKGGTWNSDNHQLLFPIPLSNITNDVNLTQNPGY